MGEACLRDGSKHTAVSSTLAWASGRQEGIAWYALKVRSGGEVNVMKALQLRGYWPYCPMQQQRRRYSDRMKVVSVPLFPGYLFCRFDAQQKFPIVSTPGVDYILGANGPVAVEEIELESIRRMVEAGAQVEPYLARGQRVRVSHGALEGIEGIVARDAKGGEKLVVSITLLNQSVSLHIDQASICVSE
ncbi:MAG: transcription termination/antitermination protein NusG [Bryobacteraceae bacterium]